MKVAVLGFGNQGEAQAHLLRRAGLEVTVGARAGGTGEARARAGGFAVAPIADAAASAGHVVVLLPDEVVAQVWPTFAPRLTDGAAVVFAHGFSLLYGGLALPAHADVVLVSPTSPGRILREVVSAGGTMPGYLAVHHDVTGAAWQAAERHADAIGIAPRWRTTVAEETEVDLFGEQAVLCGGMNALVGAAFDTLTAHGYSPEMAYLECVHQLKYLADLLHEAGPAGLRRGISGTALYGDVTRGPRVVGDASRRAMEQVLAEIRSGQFAREWLAEVAAGRRRLDQQVRAAAGLPIELARRRALQTPDAPR
ncbi:MAG TPA: ketol-acid reductoisomerase [Candidatus Eisenbacteria bacterium]|nr:ketol-acid reductoisomerase [Candidatus Eisenbacteria bacterium]